MKNEIKYKVVLKIENENEIESLWLYNKSDLEKAINAGIELYGSKSYFMVKKNCVTGESEVLNNEH